MIFNAYGDNTAALGIGIKSCGHIFAQRGRTIHRPRGREDWLLFYVAKGKEAFHLKHTVIAEEGSFLLYRPGERQEHVCVSDKTSEYYYVHFTLPGDTLPVRLETSHVYSAAPSAKARALFEDLLSELTEKRTGYQTVSVGHLLTLFGLLERSLSEQSSHGKEQEDRIAAVLQRIGKEFDRADTLDDYAKECRMSKFHFLRVFKEVTGCSPIEYRNNIRVEHAKELLLDTSIPISEIGSRIGYTSPSHFCDAFKHRVGVSPRHFRETNGLTTAE